MAKVLTTASIVTCSHSGKVATAGAARLAVNSGPVLLAASISGKPITGCLTVDDPNTATKQCTSVAAIVTGQAAKLKVGGVPVILDTLAGTTDGTPPPLGASLGTPTANQTKLQAG